MPVTMTGVPSPDRPEAKSGQDQVSAQKYSVMPQKQEVNKYLKGLPENEARQNAKMRSKVSEELGGKSRRVAGQLDQFGRPTGKGPSLDNSRQEGGTVGALSSSGEVTKDNRNAFDKAFDEQQAAWMNDDDRNNDALYHRSFDDGSMHLYSTVFRDGKAVDNHGKDLGSAGKKYRRHDLQGATLEGESATFVPLDEDNSTLRYFAACEMKNHERGWVHPSMKKHGAEPWNPAPHKPVPYDLRGMKVVTNEPWLEAVSANPELNMATTSFNRLDDGQNDSGAILFQRRKEEDDAIAANRGLIPWHGSPVLWRFPSGQAGRSIEYGETASTLAQEFKYAN